MSDLAVVNGDTGEVVIRRSGPLASLEQARALLERSKDLREVVEIRDRAEAVRHYAAAAGHGLALQNEAAELKLRAERKAGEVLAQMPKNPGGRATSDTLSEVGVEHHQSSRWQRVAALPESVFEAHIAETKAAGRELTSASVLKLAKQHVAADKPPAPPIDLVDAMPEVFGCIAIDPPWRYDNRATRGAAEDHYPTMSLDELAALELPAAADSHLYLWTTNPFLHEAFHLLDAWGFTYKTCLTWCKPQMGMGNYFRGTTEHVLFGIRGRCPTLANDIPTHFVADRTRHSAKPDAFYDLVERSSPGPRLDMFARTRRLGWYAWGNEA